jgi:nitrate reductase gamma subunit
LLLNKVVAFILFVTACAFTCSVGNAEEAKIISSLIDGKERLCLDCHRSPNIETNEGIFSSQSMCLECHAKETCKKTIEKKQISLQVKPGAFEKNRHQYAACIQCHTDVARSPHSSRVGAQCLGCHPVHGEGSAHAPHLRVSCQACHRTSKFVFFDTDMDRVRLSHFDDKKMPVTLTDHALPDVLKEDFCQRCHYPRNQVGASAAVLPAKSFLCILCHNAPLAMGHPIFWVAFFIFILGVFLTLRFWFQGSVEGEEKSLHRKIALGSESVWSVIFSREIFSVIKVVILDVILQRRILQESVKRWSIHSLIYLSILARLCLSFFTYFAYKIGPGSSLAVALIDKNHGFTAFVYDLLGLFTIVGIVWALVQRFILKPPQVATESRDTIAVVIIGLLVFLGFFLEGARILITRVPPDVAVFSFIGYPTAKLLSLGNWDWQCFYQYLWFGHAVVGALFIAYLPYSKMKHMFNTPLTLVLNYKRK